MNPIITMPVGKVMEASFRATIRMIEETKPKDICPIFLGMTAAGNQVVIACPWESDEAKYASIKQVKRLFAEHKVVSYAQTSEIWISKALEAEAKANGGKITRQPGDMPDKEERLMVVGCNGLTSSMRLYFIEREAGGAITGLRLDEAHEDITMTGRMSGLLPQEAVPAGTA